MFFRFLVSIILLLVIFNTKIDALEIKVLATVDQESISNYDLKLEKKILEILNKRKIFKKDENIILQRMINEKIKYIETKVKKIQINNENLEKRLTIVKNQNFQNQKLTKNEKNYLKEKIATEMKWNRLILINYKNKISINVNEVNELIKKNQIKENQKEKFILMEKNKKLNILSKTHFNEVKNKYYIKIYQWSL